MLVRLIAAKWCGLVAALVAALLVPASPVGAVAGFGDVDSGRYFADPVQWSVDNGITGIDGTCFSPDKPVTRGETAVWIWRMQDRSQAPAHSFVDVTAAEQQQPVAWMVSEGVTTGTSDSTFSPDRVLNRVEAAAFLWRLAGRPDAAAHSFVDVLSGWQQGPVSWMASRGITTGTSPTMFSPDGTLTRAQLITFLYRYNNSPPVTIDPDAPTCRPTEQAPQVSVAVSFGSGPYSATEGGSGAVELVLSAALEQPARIPITASGSGGADSADYFVPSSVAVPSGVTSHTFTVVAYSDTVTDTGEGLVLGFGALPEGVVAGGAATSSVRITDQPISDAVLDSAINIPDTNFKAALQKLFRKSATQEITVRDARSINTLNIPNLGISNLTGIEHFVNLVSINVQQNSLSGLVLPFLPKLTSLTASYNQLTSVVLESSKLPALETLVLHNNQLVEVELDGFTELNHVNLRYNANALETLVLRNLPKITTVHNKRTDNPDPAEGPVHPVLLYHTPLNNFTAVNLSALTTLNLPYAANPGFREALGSVVLEDLPELVSIDVRGNILGSVVLEDLPELVSINVQQNSLSGLVLPFLPKLTSLTASYNQLTSVVLESSKLPALETLVLHNNQLVEVELDGFTELNHVNLRYNANALETLVLRNLPKITTVHNKRTDNPDPAEGPVHPVLLYHTPLNNFTAVNLSALTTLNLPYAANPGFREALGSVVLEDLPELVSIDVRGNILGSVVLEDLPELVSINVQQNSLSGLVLPFLPKLTSLTASYNQLTSVVLESSKLPALETLVLHNNQLVEVELDGFTELNHVNLRYNANALETLVLRNLPKITTVHNKRTDNPDPAEGPVHPVLLYHTPLNNFTAVNLSALTTLNLPYAANPGFREALGSVVLEDLPELVSIDVRGNILGSVVLEDLPELVSINVQQNSLSGLVLPFLPKLTSLTASYNQLTSVVLESSKLPALETLVLHNNQLVEVELDGFTELNHVNLRDNVLETLVLRDLPKITTVHYKRTGNPDGNYVSVYNNPRVKVFYDFPEDSSGGSGDPVRTIPVPWRARNLRVEDVGDGVDGRRSFTASWDAPEREGDSVIEGYTVTVSHPRVSPSVAAWSHSYEVTDRSFRFDHGDPGYTYKVSVRAQNSFGSGPATSQEITIRCMSGDKYRINREGGVDLGFLGTHGDHSRVYALQDFKLVPNGWEIKQGYKGGVVFDAGSLSQDGCAWIYQDAAVEGNGKVSGNAVLVNQARVKDNSEVSGNAVISDDAKVSNSATVSGNARISDHAEVYDSARVYGDAQVSGDARVYDSAQVYGDAQVSGDAKVYDSAQVYGNAEVSGDAKVYGHARVFGNVVLLAGDEVSCDSEGHKSCNYNGDLEYEYAAEQLRQNFKDSLYNAFLECNSGDSAAARKSVKDILDAKDSTSITVGVLHLEGCGILKIFRDIVREFTPGPIEFILQWGFVAGSALKLGTFGASLLELLKGIDDISTLIETRKTLDEILKDAHQMLRTK